VDGTGNIFIADAGGGGYNNVVLKVNPAGVITIVAGDGYSPGFSGDGGPAAHYALLNSPSGVTVDGAGNVFIADQGNNRIRKVNSAGVITTVGGNGTSGFNGDGGPATSAQLQLTEGVAVDGAGNLFIGDWGNNRVRKVTLDGLISTVAGGGNAFIGEGIPATAASFNRPTGLAVDGSGNLFISDSLYNRVRKVTPDGLITTVAVSGNLANPYGVAIDGLGNLFIGDRGNNRVRKVTPDDLVTTVDPISAACLSAHRQFRPDRCRWWLEHNYDLDEFINCGGERTCQLLCR